MEKILTPKQVARAIGVSESSIKRWCDRGLIPTARTAGKHRRLGISDVLQFVRATGQELVHPEVLGLPATTGQGPRVLDRAQEQFRQAIVEGDEAQARAIVFDIFLADHSISAICDHVMADAFHDIGDLWECGSVEVYQERRGCEICLHVLHELRLAVPEAASTAPLAMGGTPAGDVYHLPTTMVELVLRENGWQAVSLGSGLPFATIRAALEEHQPRIFWLSVSHLPDEEAFVRNFNALQESITSQTALVVGGRALHADLRRNLHYTAFCDNLHQLESFASTLQTTPSPVDHGEQ